MIINGKNTTGGCQVFDARAGAFLTDVIEIDTDRRTIRSLEHPVRVVGGEAVTRTRQCETMFLFEAERMIVIDLGWRARDIVRHVCERQVL